MSLDDTIAQAAARRIGRQVAKVRDLLADVSVEPEGDMLSISIEASTPKAAEGKRGRTSMRGRVKERVVVADGRKVKGGAQSTMPVAESLVAKAVRQVQREP